MRNCYWRSQQSRGIDFLEGSSDRVLKYELDPSFHSSTTKNPVCAVFENSFQNKPANTKNTVCPYSVLQFTYNQLSDCFTTGSVVPSPIYMRPGSAPLPAPLATGFVVGETDLDWRVAKTQYGCRPSPAK